MSALVTRIVTTANFLGDTKRWEIFQGTLYLKFYWKGVGELTRSIREYGFNTCSMSLGDRETFQQVMSPIAGVLIGSHFLGIPLISPNGLSISCFCVPTWLWASACPGVVFPDEATLISENKKV